MKQKIPYPPWLLSLLFLTLSFPNDIACSYSPISIYKQQVIFILDSDSTTQKAGRLLYEQHDTFSHVVTWNGAEQKFKLVEWNMNEEKFDASADLDQCEFPIGPQKSFAWTDTLIQVVGLENATDERDVPTISGFSPTELALLIAVKLTSGDEVGSINVIIPSQLTSDDNQSFEFLSQFINELRQLQSFKTSVALRHTLVMIDHSGRMISGQLIHGVANETDIHWRHIDHLNTLSSSFFNVLPKLKSPFFGILPPGVQVFVTDYYERETLQTKPRAYVMTDKGVFRWVDNIAQNTYGAISKSRAPSIIQQVQFLSGEKKVSNVSVVEFTDMTDFLKELHHYGNEGPVNDNNKVYVRFGDWILSMDEATFNVNLEGIITCSTDSCDKKAQVEQILSHWQGIPKSYPSMQSNTNENFFKEVSHWIRGENYAIGLEMENAYNAQCGAIMFFSAAIRSFHVHVTNMMSLDLAEHDYLTREYFFSSHPLARKETWQIWNARSRTGLNMLHEDLDQAALVALNETIHRISCVSKSWLSHISSETIMGSRGPPPATWQEEYTGMAHQANLLSFIEDIASSPPMSHNYLREYELKESRYRLLTWNLSEPELGVIAEQIQDFLFTDDVSLPLRASVALANDQAYVSNLITKELHLKQLQTGKRYKVVPDSIEVKDQSNTVRFFVQELSNVSSELEPITVTFDKSKLRTKAMLEKFPSKLKTLLSLSKDANPVIKGVNKGVGIVNTVVGIASSILEFERGNIPDVLKGTFGLAKNVYKVGDIIGINRAAKTYLAQALKPTVLAVSKPLVGAVNVVKARKTAFSLVKGVISGLLSTAGLILDGYNIYEDFHCHSTLGYINGAFDIVTTLLSLTGPEAEPFTTVLSLIKMGVDLLYTDIGRELHALPPQASITQKVVAVIKGIVDSFVDFIHTFDLFYSMEKADKLDEQYSKNQRFLNRMADYKSYFNVTKVNEPNQSEINFVMGIDSWNGGDITFILGENGHSNLSIKTVDSNGYPIQDNHSIDTEGVENIVLGIGESHTISFRKETVHFLWFIPIDTKKVISNVTGDRQTLYGTYYGNSQNNKLIAIQDLPQNVKSKLNYNLRDYHYTLYGRGGNDSFYLGPQQTYVEGNEGSDVYFINSTATFTQINNYSGDKQTDTMIINLDYNQLTARRQGTHLKLTKSNTHRIVVQDWFHNASHRHMVFRSGDGIHFKISATTTEKVEKIAYAISGSSATRSQVYDARKPKFSQVLAIFGSNLNDTIFGNDLDNQLNGAGDNDWLMGGDGRDTYNVDQNAGIDTINNFAMDGLVDSLVISASLDQLTFSSHNETDDLYITSHMEDEQANTSTGAVISKWFSNKIYQHMVVVTNDKEVVQVSKIKTQTVSYQRLIINMSRIITEYDPGSPFTRKLDLNSELIYSEVLTVFGTPSNDFIIGNGKGNFITGAQGFDCMEGREGSDTYVVKKGDGRKKIVNCAKDKKVDTLHLMAKFDDIVLSLLNSSRDDLVLSGRLENSIEVTLGSWFKGSQCQHLLVRSADGVTFKLPKTTDTQLLEKRAKSIDNSNLTSDVQLSLLGKWKYVERVIGSQGHDVIIGNGLNNYLDPGRGGCYLQGGNGSDTYVIRSTYGEKNVINNYAKDDHTDTVFFLVPFSTIKAKVVGKNVSLSSSFDDGPVAVLVLNYTDTSKTGKYARHLVVTTSDGVSFFLPLVNGGIEYRPIPVSINLVQTTAGQYVNLTAHPNFHNVRTVYGSSSYQNTIIGNGLKNTLVGGDRQDQLQGHEGDDILKGRDGHDIITGGSGADTIVGGDGDDHLDGGEGDDIISPGSGANEVYGGPGTDTVIYSGNVQLEKGVDLDLSHCTCVHDEDVKDMLSGIENAYGTEFNDTLQGDDKDNILVGHGGSDYLAPGSGYDLLKGGNDKDTYDLTDANGTVTIINFAEDKTWDVVIMSYANISNMWYEIVGEDVVLRAINSRYRVFYDGNKPTVVFKSFLLDAKHQHIQMEMADGSIVDLSTFINNHNQDAPDTQTSALLAVYIAIPLLLFTLCVLVGCTVTVVTVYKIYVKRKPRAVSLDDNQYTLFDHGL